MNTVLLIRMHGDKYRVRSVHPERGGSGIGKINTSKEVGLKKGGPENGINIIIEVRNGVNN